MQNILNFLRRFHLFILFVALEIVALAFLVRNNNYQRAGYVRISGSVAGTVNEKIGRTREYFSLKENNRFLAEENVLLLNQLGRYYRTIYQAKDSVLDSVYKQRYVYFSAHVVNNSVNKQYNYITIDKGKKDGMRQDMAVISPNGIVGFVAGVSDNYSVVLPVLNRNFNISAKLKKTNFFGPLTWEGLNSEKCILKDIPHHVPVNVGDTVVTTGYSGSFPEGIMIGTVASRDIKDGNFYDIKVKLSTDFRSLSYVNVVDDLQKEEQTNLEKQFQHD
jgi:rod shape-determining protein MreC